VSSLSPASSTSSSTVLHRAAIGLRLVEGDRARLRWSCGGTSSCAAYRQSSGRHRATPERLITDASAAKPARNERCRPTDRREFWSQLSAGGRTAGARMTGACPAPSGLRLTTAPLTGRAPPSTRSDAGQSVCVGAGADSLAVHRLPPII